MGSHIPSRRARVRDPGDAECHVITKRSLPWSVYLLYCTYCTYLPYLHWVRFSGSSMRDDNLDIAQLHHIEAKGSISQWLPRPMTKMRHSSRISAPHLPPAALLLLRRLCNTTSSHHLSMDGHPLLYLPRPH